MLQINDNYFAYDPSRLCYVSLPTALLNYYAVTDCLLTFTFLQMYRTINKNGSNKFNIGNKIKNQKPVLTAIGGIEKTLATSDAA